MFTSTDDVAVYDRIHDNFMTSPEYTHGEMLPL